MHRYRDWDQAGQGTGGLARGQTQNDFADARKKGRVGDEGPSGGTGRGAIQCAELARVGHCLSPLFLSETHARPASNALLPEELMTHRIKIRFATSFTFTISIAPLRFTSSKKNRAVRTRDQTQKLGINCWGTSIEPRIMQLTHSNLKQYWP